MAERSNRTRRERLRYGMCLSEECEKCKTKEIQAIPMRKEFVCPVCGKELRECPPPKKGNKGLIYGAIAALVILAIALFFCLVGGKSGETPTSVDSTKQDTVLVEVMPADSTHIKSDTIIKSSDDTNVHIEGSTVIEEHVTSTVTTIHTQSSNHSSSLGGKQTTLKLSYGKYVGETKGGYPHGSGRLTYNQQRQISRYDQKARKAEPGDYVIGEFFNGFLVHGKHYNSNSELIESIILGTPRDDAFESK